MIGLLHHSHRIFASVAFAVFVAVFATGSALAQDANAVAQKLRQTLGTRGYHLSWVTATGNGSQMVLDGVIINNTGTGAMLDIGKVVLDDVSEEKDGGYNIGTLTFPAISRKEPGSNFQMTPTTLSGVKVPPGGADYFSNILFYDSARIDRIEFTRGDKQALLIENIHISAPPPTAGSLTVSVGADKLSADLTALPDLGPKVTLLALGYEQITGAMRIALNWNLESGRAEFSKFDLTVDNAGTLGVTFDLGGVTREFFNEMKSIEAKINANPELAAQKAAKAQMDDLLFQSFTLNGASIRFDDASITNKVLDFIAQQEGADPVQIKEQAKTIVPFLLASSPIKDEALKKNIAEAVAAYLDDPKNLTIRAKPATPQLVGILDALAKSDPGSLPTALGLSVSTNE